MTPREIVEQLLQRGFKLVFWPGTGDWKGPHEKDWLAKGAAGHYDLSHYKDGDRVGIMHGVEMAAGRYVVDIDIDWAPGRDMAVALLPTTGMSWGRASKSLSHCIYTTPDVLPEYKYKDIGKDGRVLLEFRADVHQSMAPPSVWEKDGVREQIGFVSFMDPTHFASAALLKYRADITAIGMLLAIHIGYNGFGHATRLAWAGFLMRHGLSDEELHKMGMSLSRYCNNTELDDVKRSIDSTRIIYKKEDKKTSGGPALAKLIGEKGKAVVARILEWLGHEQDFERKNGVPIADSQRNIKRALALMEVELTYDEFGERPILNGQRLQPAESRALWFRIQEEYNFKPSFEGFFLPYLEYVARLNSFHPVKQYLLGLKWDGIERVNTWLVECANVESSTYVFAVSSIMLIAAVRRIMQPGCKYDEMVVWESAQGTNKSSAAQALCPKQEWFSDDLRLNLQSKELIESTLGKWIIEASELAGKRKSEVEQLKAMLSRPVDGPARMAYAPLPVERPRHFILIGTTNSSTYLTDSTGGRRFWPVVVKQFNVEWIIRNRDQLWAEAVTREAAGESIRMPASLWEAAAKHQEARQEIGIWEETLRGYLLTKHEEKFEGEQIGKLRIGTQSLYDVLGITVDREDQGTGRRITEIMQHLGFSRTTVRDEKGKVVRGFICEDNKRLILDASEEKEEEEKGEDKTLF